MATLKLPSISERRSPSEQASSHIDLDRTRMPTYGVIELTIRIPRTGQHKVGLHLWARDGYFKVAVDLRATQPDQNGFQSYRFGSYGNAYQWHDRTRTPAKVSVQQMVASFSVYQVLTSPVKVLKRLRQPTIVPST